MPNLAHSLDSPRQPRRARGAETGSAAVLWMSLLLPGLVAGCVSLKRHPVADNVVHARQLSHRGIDAMQQGKWDEAEMLFAEAIENCPADERAHRRYAETLWHRGAWNDAIEHMKLAVSLSGEDAALLVQLGEMYLSRGEVLLAGQKAERAIHRKRQSAGAWELRGDVFRQRGDLDEAMLSYHRALSLEADKPSAQRALSELYLHQQRPRRALSTLESLASSYATRDIPQDVLLLQGRALKDLGRFDDAIVVLAQAAQRQSDSDVLCQLAEVQWLAGDTASAHVAVQGVLERVPHDPQALALLAAIRESLNSQQNYGQESTVR